MLGISSAPLGSLHVALTQLAPCQRLTNTLLSALWQGVVHQRPLVRVATCSLFTKIVPHVPEHVVSSRVIPALVTLASDTEVMVKVATLPVYALVLQQNSKNKEFLDKSYLQIQSVLSDPSVIADTATMIPIINALSEMNPHADTYFREQVILVELHRLTNAAFDLDPTSPRKSQVTSVLVDSFSNVIFLQLSKSAIVATLLPTLRVLESLCKEAVPTLTEAAAGMIREVETRAGLNEAPPHRSPTSPTSLGAAGVEEVRAKVTKMFNAAPKPAGLSSLGDIFRKNKQ
uniref:SCY1-like protein 2 n=1 Tax=Lygus hesperus TaxID=30085 RepID=A0A0A9Y448_LYGHE